MPSAQLLARISDRRDSSPASTSGEGPLGGTKHRAEAGRLFPVPLRVPLTFPKGRDVS